jgi:ribonuclease D
VLVAHQAQIDEICARCRAEGGFAFDTEFVMEDRYESEVCLIQIATRDSVAVLDPFRKLNLQPVWSLVSDEEVEVVVHAGQEDLGLSVQHTGRLPRRVFDVQIAAGLAGYDYPISLQRIVQALLHVRLHKSKTLTDWRRRPLSEAQIRYAAEDVAHLLTLRQRLYDKLDEFNRIGWAREEFHALEEPTLYKRAAEDKLARVKGAGKLNGEQLATAYELLTWRDALAKRRNRPARAALKDHLLVEIARHGLTDVREIRDLRGLNLGDRDIRALAGVVRKAREIPSSEWPKPKPRSIDTPREAALVALATAVVRCYCMEHGLAYGLVATQKSIRELIGHSTFDHPTDGTSVELLTGWRGETVGAMLADVLSGRRMVRIEELDGERTVHVTPAT